MLSPVTFFHVDLTCGWVAEESPKCQDEKDIFFYTSFGGGNIWVMSIHVRITHKTVKSIRLMVAAISAGSFLKAVNRIFLLTW